MRTTYYLRRSSGHIWGLISLVFVISIIILLQPKKKTNHVSTNSAGVENSISVEEGYNKCISILDSNWKLVSVSTNGCYSLYKLGISNDSNEHPFKNGVNLNGDAKEYIYEFMDSNSISRLGDSLFSFDILSLRVSKSELKSHFYRNIKGEKPFVIDPYKINNFKIVCSRIKENSKDNLDLITMQTEFGYDSKLYWKIYLFNFTFEKFLVLSFSEDGSIIRKPKYKTPALKKV